MTAKDILTNVLQAMQPAEELDPQGPDYDSLMVAIILEAGARLRSHVGEDAYKSLIGAGFFPE